MTTVTIGIIPQEQIRERDIAIARGEYKPGSKELKVLFPSINSLAGALSVDNRALLQATFHNQKQNHPGKKNGAHRPRFFTVML